MGKHWSEAEKNFVRANAALLKDSELAAVLCRLRGKPVTLYAVRHIRERMGIRKAHGRGVNRVLVTPRMPAGMGLVIKSEPSESTSAIETQFDT